MAHTTVSGVATIEDVANEAGVSVATVSRALRGLPHVSPSTRARVRRIADEMDYRANPHASRLAAGRSGTIGVAVPILNSWFYGNILAGVETVVSQDQLDMHLLTVDGRPAMERFVAELPALSKQVDGLVMVDLFMPPPMWEALALSDLPIATVGVDTGSFDSVLIDNLGAARRAVRHLLDLGHRRVGFIGDGVDESLEFVSAELRRKGMVEALAERGLEADPSLQVPGGFSVEGGTEGMNLLLERHPPPTAVFCASDEMAIGAMRAVAEAGLDVPGDVSIVGFDDHVVSEALGLTTVHQPVSAMAARAAGLVLRRVDSPATAPTRFELETELRVRHTTAGIT